ncbi:riboflavin biosynthesis protein RibF [Leptotrichia sp. OH3620_COT-345]|uniref:riboflavin biosynthesis protein RibF n=1 Tax=Leptotrichia sp. OH3620_COT-345 TaxID=2491048 RepID=UPI000F6487D3|nr:riboflavin biosynthesis protein RibF [Leptotrichia sp. OH3620_COT-345]RRD40910.1 riboflavin biosynthesis protein RibF [Leptotrichia sp. OH3620_COT-345]
MSIKIISKNQKNIEEFLKFRNMNCSNADDIKESQNIVILGNFDGVHEGHRKIFDSAVKKSLLKGYKSVVYTFSEYPQKKESRITTPSEKLELISGADINYIYLDEFEDVKNFSPEEFVDKILIKTLNTKEIYCGFNFTFGKNKSGNIKVLDNIIREKYNNSIALNVQPPVLDNENEIISSTRIRRYIEKSDLTKMKELLGHNFIIMGKVIHGKKLGRTLGFPTANLTFENRIYPEFGVYGVYIHIEGENKIYHGAMNIGKNPTVESDCLNVETHIFDFDKDIYGKIILIEILEKIRDEVKLNSLDELMKKIEDTTHTWRKRIDEKYYDTSKNR